MIALNLLNIVTAVLALGAALRIRLTPLLAPNRLKGFLFVPAVLLSIWLGRSLQRVLQEFQRDDLPDGAERPHGAAIVLGYMFLSVVAFFVAAAACVSRT